MKKRLLIKTVNKLERDTIFQVTAYRCYNQLNLNGLAEEYLRKKYKEKYLFISDFTFRSFYRGEKSLVPYRKQIAKLYKTATL